MKNIFICASARRSVFFKIIKFFTAETIDKITIIFEDGGEEKVLEATLNGYDIIPLSKWKLKNKIFARVKIMKTDLTISVNGILNEKSTRNKFCFFVKNKIKSPLKSVKKKIETDLVIRILKESGVGNSINKTHNTPQKLYSFIMDNFYCTITKVKKSKTS